MKPVAWLPRARQDAAEAAAWLADEGGIALGERFLDALAGTLDQLARFPACGSTRHAAIVPGLPAPLRFLPVSGFERHLVYHLDLPERVLVLRIWHAARGLEALMPDPSGAVPSIHDYDEPTP